MPTTIKVNGLILKISDTPGKDKLLHVLTRGGFLTAFATPKRSAGKKDFTYDLFNYCEFVLYETGRGNYLVNSVRPLEYFYPLREDMARLALAGYLAQLSRFVAGDADCDCETLMDLLLSALSRLSNGADVHAIKPVFELRSAKLLGFTPCLEAEQKSSEYFFSLEDGRLLLSAAPNTVKLPRSSVVVIYKILAADGAAAFDVPQGECTGDIYALAQQYILFHVERGFSTLDFLNGVL